MESSPVKLRNCMVLSVVFHVGLIAIPVHPAVRSLHSEAVLLVIDSRVTAAEDDEPQREERERVGVAKQAAITSTEHVMREGKLESELTEPPPSLEAPEILPDPNPRDIAISADQESRRALARAPTSMPEADVDALPPVGAGGGATCDAPVHVSFGSAWGPRFLRQVMPAYPTKARRLRREGNVVLKLSIDQNGELVNVEVIEGAGFGFDEEAVTAAKRSTYRPAVLDGKPIACEALFPIRFQLR